MRISVIASAICLCLVSLAQADAAKAAIRRPTNIPAEELGSALQTLAKDYDFQVLYRTEIVSNLKTQGAVGTLTSDEALGKVLIGTGLTFKYLDDKTVTIVPASAAGSGQATTQNAASGSSDDASSSKEGKKSSSPDFRVAQADQGAAGSQTVGNNDDQNSKKKKKEEGLEEIVVTGSRIPTAAGQQALPVHIYTREEIQTSGQTTVADFLNTLPDASIKSVEGDFQSFLGRTTVQLHGLPAGTTLTLLNGRPIESSTVGYFDLSAIPVAAIERIEVLPVGSSAVYGSDALAGAVNMILRKDFNALEVDAKYGRASGTGEDDFSLAWGKTWDRGSVSLVANYQGRSQLLGSGRTITSTTDVPADATAFDLTDQCFPGTVYSLNGQPLSGLGTATQAAIPANIKGAPTLQEFLATAGRVNRCNVDLADVLIPTTHREGALLAGHYEISSSADLFTEVLFSHEFQANVVGNLFSLYGGSFGYTTIGAGNPYNPFGEDVGVSYTYPGLPGSYDNWQTFVRPLVGIRGSLASDWKYEVTTLISQDQTHDEYQSTNQTTLQAALNSTNPATALNPFTSGAPGSPQLLQSLLGDYADSFKNQLISAQAVLHGTLFNLPSGPVQTAVGVQYDHERLYDALNDNYAPPSSLDLSRHSYAVFAEERVPLLGAKQPNSGERLVLSLAERYDKYSDFGGKGTGQAGLEWRPSSSLLLRAAYATSYRAPQLQQIAGGITGTFPEQVTDPYRGNSTYSPLTEQGSNLKLRPETGDSRVLGIVYDSGKDRGLTASLNYFAISLTNYISILSAQVLVDYPTLFPTAVTRAPTTLQDRQLGYLGVITNIADIYQNYGDIRVSGLDFNVSHRLPTAIGDFKTSVALTDMVRYRAALTPGAQDVSYLNQATLYLGPGFTPRWKGTVSLGWQRGALSTNLTGRYIGLYHDYQDIVPNTNELGNTWYCDLNLRYDLSKGLGSAERWYHQSFVEVGAVNLLNNLPKFSYSGFGYDFAESDIRGRFVYAQLGLRL